MTINRIWPAQTLGDILTKPPFDYALVSEISAIEELQRAIIDDFRHWRCVFDWFARKMREYQC